MSVSENIPSPLIDKSKGDAEYRVAPPANTPRVNAPVPAGAKLPPEDPDIERAKASENRNSVLLKPTTFEDAIFLLAVSMAAELACKPLKPIENPLDIDPSP